MCNYASLNTYPREGLLYSYTDNAKYYPCHFVYREGDILYITTRQTRTPDDWETDIDFVDHPAIFGTRTIYTHRGAYISAQHVYENTKQFIKAHNGKIVFTGFSLGGTVAQILLPMALYDPEMAGKDMICLGFEGAPALEYAPPEAAERIFMFINQDDIITTMSGPNLYDTYRSAIEEKRFKEQITADVNSITMQGQFPDQLKKLLFGHIDSLTATMYAYHQDKNLLKVRYLQGTVFRLMKGVHYNYLNDSIVPATSINRILIYATAINDHSLWALSVKLSKIGVPPTPTPTPAPYNPDDGKVVKIKYSAFIASVSIAVLVITVLLIVCIIEFISIRRLKHDQKGYGSLSTNQF